MTRFSRCSLASLRRVRRRGNPRFVVTSLKRAEVDARHSLRSDLLRSGRECQLDLFADLTSAATMRANQLRLWFASMAYVLLCALRRIGLAHTQFAQATRCLVDQAQRSSDVTAVGILYKL